MAVFQTGYWGRGAMDPEPGRCRRTDGKKWRCSRDVVGGQKYCERHMHRGRNRSRKHVETPKPPTPSNAPPLASIAVAASASTTATATATTTHFSLSGPSSSIDLVRLHQR